MSKTNQDICHDFFYDGDGSSCRRRYCNVGYDNDTFYSYNTAIARIVAAHNGEEVCLISYDSFSRTTARHLSYLKQACPITSIFVPAQYECNTLDEEDVLQWFFADLNRAAAQKLTQAANRNGFINTFQYFQHFLNYFHDLLLTKEQEEQLEKHKELYDTLNSSDGVKKLKEKQRQEDARKAYDGQSNLTSEERRKLIKQINPDDLYSYVWQHDEYNYITSQRVWIRKEEGDLLLKLLHHGKLKHGYQISRYTVVSVTENNVKIGCHLIPRQNLEELYQVLQEAKEPAVV